MHNTGYDPLRAARRFWLPLAAVFVALVSAAFGQDEASRRNYNVPAGPAEETLKVFSSQSGSGLIAGTDTVRGVRTAPVRGSFTAQEALDQMLADTGLVVVRDEKSGAFTVRRETELEKNGASRRADGTTAGAIRLQEYQVTDRKVDGLNNKGLLQGGTESPVYHDVVTRVDIERLGVTSMEELFRLIPQTSSPTVFFQTNDQTTSISGGLTTRFSTMGLRGFNSTQTVILVNGRALPRSSTGGGPDLSRIPLAAIERVEIMPYSGSAIYGAGAIGGAINIILRKGYSGQEVSVYGGITTDGGAGEYRFSFLDGRTFHGDRGRITTTFSYQHRDPLRFGQRDFLNDAIARYTPTNRAMVDASGRPAFESFILPALAGNPATIIVGNAPNAAVNDLGIPGAPGVRWATVPAGTSPAASLLLTPSSFASTAGQYRTGDAPRQARNILYEPLDSYSITSQVEYDIMRDERLSAYGEFSVGYTRKQYSFPMASQVSLSATDPLNPFRTNVTPGFVGRPITVYFSTPDVNEPSTTWEYESARAVVGLKGRLSERFDWSVDGAIDYAHNIVDSNNPPNNVLALSALTSVATAAPAAQRRAIYPILADHDQFPITGATNQQYFHSIRFFASHSTQKEGNARITGDVFDLPAGTVRASVFSKYQDWENEGQQNTSVANGYSQLIFGTNDSGPANISGTPASRTIWQNAIEVTVPVISEQWRPIPLEGFEIQGSMSQERDTTMQPGRPANKQTGDNSVIAAKLSLTKDIAFRASYSEAFAPPDWGQVLSPPSSFIFPQGALPDPARGNTIQGPAFNVLSGGNPNLKPEQAASENFGIIFTPRFLPKMSLHLDYWHIEKTDAILSVGWPTSIANPALYGFLITRAAPTAADTAAGWAGVVTEFDQRPINASRTETEGVDLRLRYTYDTDTIGSFEFNGTASFTNNFLLQVTPTSPVINTANGSGPVRWRGNGSVTWNMRPWTLTATARYVGHYSNNTSAPSPSFPGALQYDGGRVPAYMHYDLQATYEFSTSYGERGWRNWMSGTKWTIGAINVLNEKPDFVTGRSFYNSYDDPRQRILYVQLTKMM